MRSYAVVALFHPLEIGATISRRAWPAHITLASNFTTASTPDQIIEVVTEAAPAAVPLNVRFGEEALFGPNHDVRVRLVESGQAVSVHMRLTDQLESLPGFVPEEPAYWRDGYRPHLTLGPSVTATEGNRETANSVAVIEILDSDAKVLALLHPRGAR
ncbi:2'-5' RNA ligase family protein [Leifsonia shinshuensis]|uniref:2'-5' RNA ligase family protein n=1 Tax=Leifsonia shinshuensis TaxID=150026 RepID=UPI002858A814|nr:2'-5' RNA ligase family protein [Leifsonia shinshuensis]MDR6971571.1 2'-5' RNA ligase [Leifsonia shinshuensis]